MRRVLVVAFISLSTGAAWPSLLSAKDNCKDSKTDFCAVKLVNVYDGDSFKVAIPNVHPLLGEKIGIRVYGLDTPERRTKDQCEKSKAMKAKSIVENALTNATRIDLKDCIRGKYFRLVCKVHYDGKSLTDLLISKELAYAYFGKKKQKVDWCKGPKLHRLPASKGESND